MAGLGEALEAYVGPGIIDAKDLRVRSDVLRDPTVLIGALPECFAPKGGPDGPEPA